MAAHGRSCCSSRSLPLPRRRLPPERRLRGLFSWVLTETLFRWFVPDESFPVSYRRGGNAAHLDLGGREPRP